MSICYCSLSLVFAFKASFSSSFSYLYRKRCGSRLSFSSKALYIKCKDVSAIESLGARIARLTFPPSVILLSGDLGAGKTCFSRGFIREKLQDDQYRVTSPSYLLDNSYQYYETSDEEEEEEEEEAMVSTIHHMDLYRLPTGE